MALLANIELADVPVKAQIGIFPAGEPDPHEHMLDLKLRIDPALVFITQDGMQYVFDYDPLLEKIHAVSQNKHYETQEVLASHIVRCCAEFEQIEGVEICLKKFRPNGSGGTICGTIGVRLEVSGKELAGLRAHSDMHAY